MRSTVLCIAMLMVATVHSARAQESVCRFNACQLVFPDTARMEALLDVDGDGFMDAAGAFGYVGWSVDLWRNDQTGRLVPTQNIPVPTFGTPDAEFADTFRARLDGDSRDDLVFVLWNMVVGFFAQPTGAPLVQGWNFTPPGSVRSARVFDWDSDGISDLALLTSNGLFVYHGIPGGAPQLAGTYSFSPFPVGSPSSLDHWSMIDAEIDGDGLVDLVVVRVNFAVNPIAATVWRIPWVGAGLTTAATSTVTGFSSAGAMTTAGDLDGDGDVDLVMFDPGIGGWAPTGTYRVLRRTGPATFAVEPSRPGGPADRLVDVDGDGDLDGACCGSGGGNPVRNTATATFRISFNTGGVLGAAVLMPGVGASHLAGVADLDHDGDLDLVSGRAVYYARGPLSPTSMPRFGRGESAVPPSARAFGDFDRDGDPDVQFGIGDPGIGQGCFTNSGDGTFSTTSLAVPPPPAGTTWFGPGISLDVDGDGDRDLLLEVRTPFSLVGMRRLLNVGGGGLVDGGPATPAADSLGKMGGSSSGPRQTDALVADLDGDGDLDVIMSPDEFGVMEADVWRNVGGSFTRAQVIPQFRARAVADFDGDGDLDILGQNDLFPNQGPPQLVISRAHGALTYDAQPGVVVATGYSFGTMREVVGDLDDDGDVDVAFVQQGLNLPAELRVRRNDGSGAVFSASTLSLGPIQVESAGRLVRVDADGDGQLDLMASVRSQAVLLRKSAPGFNYVVDPVNLVVEPMAVVDVDGDGDEDLTGGSVWRATRIEPPTGGTRLQYGAGVAGSGGFVPVIGDVGPFRQGLSGEIRLTNALGGAAAVFVIGGAPANVPLFGGSLLVEPTFAVDFTTSGAPGAPGAGTWTLPWTLPLGLAGLSIYHQIGVLDAGAPQGVAATGGLYVLVGS